MPDVIDLDFYRKWKDAPRPSDPEFFEVRSNDCKHDIRVDVQDSYMCIRCQKWFGWSR